MSKLNLTNFRWNKVICSWVILLIGFTCSLLIFTSPANAAIPTEANLKVAFLGDTGIWSGFNANLNMIKNENADLVVHLGDFDYEGNPNAFRDTINSVLGANFPYIYVVGNHDSVIDEPYTNTWPPNCGNNNGCYADHFQQRMSNLGINIDLSDGGRLGGQDGDMMYTIDYKGLLIVGIGNGDYDTSSSGIGNSTYAPYIQRKMQNDDHLWKICAWHMNQQQMQVGGKGNSMGWGVYETCRQQGAIVATAHEHTYHRTKTLSSLQNQIVDPLWPDPNNLRVEPGKTFAFVSGLGGGSIRDQERCRPTTYPYGCKGEWAFIYTSNQNAQYGTLFITFNVDGDPTKANAYFKNIQGQIVDQFTITTVSSGSTTSPSPQTSARPTPRTSASPSLLPSTSPTPSGGTCRADINSNGVVNLTDFLLLAMYYATNNQAADIDHNGKVNNLDFAIFRSEYGRTCTGNNPSATPIASAQPSPTSSTSHLFPWGVNSPFNHTIPANATYTLDPEIGSIRPNYEAWSVPIYRVPAGSNVPLVTVVNNSSGRTHQWPIPTSAQPAPEADAHMAIYHFGTNISYEFWDAAWSGTNRINAGGMNSFPLAGTGISDPPNYRVTASGFAVSAGAVVREDFINPQTGQLDANQPITHALAMALNFSKIDPTTYVAPAVGAETNGRGGNTPMGTLYALPRNLNIDSLNVHPLTKAMARAIRDYGVYVNDSCGCTNYQNKYTGSVRVEIGLIQQLFGVANDTLLNTIQQQMYNIISQNGLYRVTGVDFSYAN